MIQFNLLPDIKLEYLKAQRNRRLVISISVLVTAASIVLAGVLFSITAIQKARINNLQSDIKKQSANLTGQKNLNDILTVQNQIATLNQLHQQEPAASNLATYLNQTIPSTAGLNNLTIDFITNSITMNGNANSLATVNQLVDSLKFATYTIGGVKGSNKAFSNVVLSSFGVSSQGTTFGISLNFDSNLFNNTENVTLNVPSKVTTRSELSQPTVLFQQNKTTNGSKL
jgi:Tfp pilus assembly protein PilN